MKRLAAALLMLAFAACHHPPEEAAATRPSKATPQASPSPQPGAWMWPKKSENKLGFKDGPSSALDDKSRK
jgi:hypothetical protein